MSGHSPSPSRPTTYVAVDVENLVIDGTARSRHERVQAVQAALDLVGGPWIGVAALADRRLASALALAVPRLRVYRVPPTPDAADRELAERLATDVPSWIRRVVIMSGDHAFAPVARALRVAGKQVACIGIQGHIHHRMWGACSQVVATTLYH